MQACLFHQAQKDMQVPVKLDPAASSRKDAAESLVASTSGRDTNKIAGSLDSDLSPRLSHCVHCDM